MRAFLPVLAVLLLVAPMAAAQTRINPIQGSFGATYVVAGRAVDETGAPIVHGTVVAELSASGVQAAPLDIGTDCYGFFEGYYTLREVDPQGKIAIHLDGPNGTGRSSGVLDPFFRRTNLNVTYPGTWHGDCTDPQQAEWKARVTVSGRIVKRVDPYDDNGLTLQARPTGGFVRLALVFPNGARFCPPSSQGGAANPDLCDPQPVDERGDFRYSWTFASNFPAQGHVEVSVGNHTENVTIDPVMRIAFAKVETTGQGAPPIEKPSPGPGALALVGMVGLVAVARRLYPRRPR